MPGARMPHLDLSTHPFLTKTFDPKPEPVPPLRLHALHLFISSYLSLFVLKNLLLRNNFKVTEKLQEYVYTLHPD